jgi:hypothetical protein
VAYFKVLSRDAIERMMEKYESLHFTQFSAGDSNRICVEYKG